MASASICQKFELGLNNLVDRAVQGNRLAWRELMNTMERFGIKLTQGPNSGLTFIIEDGPSNDQVTREQDKRRGRRKELPNYGNILLRMLNKKVISIVDGKRRRISKFELCLDNLAAQAPLGDRLAWRGTHEHDGPLWRQTPEKWWIKVRYPRGPKNTGPWPAIDQLQLIEPPPAHGPRRP